MGKLCKLNIWNYIRVMLVTTFCNYLVELVCVAPNNGYCPSYTTTDINTPIQESQNKGTKKKTTKKTGDWAMVAEGTVDIRKGRQKRQSQRATERRKSHAQNFQKVGTPPPQKNPCHPNGEGKV